MNDSLSTPEFDPTPLFDIVRWSHGTELLAVAVSHFDLFALLTQKPMTLAELGSALNLHARPANVLAVALSAMGLLQRDEARRLFPSPLATEHLVPGSAFYMGDYVGLGAQTPGVLNMLQRLRTNKPIESDPADKGAAFIFRDGLDSAMEQADSARRLTLALAGRARIVGPVLAQRVDLSSATRLLDIGGGTGLYAIAMLRAYPSLRATVWDRPEVLKVAFEMAERHGVVDRLELSPGDMFTGEVPPGCDVMLLSNILHDWDVPECQRLLNRCAAALPSGGRLIIHDVYLDDDLTGPLPVALYSAALFNVTEGRAYSAAEYRDMLETAGLVAHRKVITTAVHCGALIGEKP